MPLILINKSRVLQLERGEKIFEDLLLIERGTDDNNYNLQRWLERRISVVVITPDSESGNPSSNLGSVSLFVLLISRELNLNIGLLTGSVVCCQSARHCEVDIHNFDGRSMQGWRSLMQDSCISIV